MENTNNLQRGNLIAINDKYYLDSIFEIEIITRTGITTSQVIVPEKRIKYQGFGVEQIVPLSITPETLNLFDGWTNKDGKFGLSVNRFYFRYEPTKSHVSVWRIWSGFILNVSNIHSLQNAYTLFSGGEQLKLK